MQDECRHCSFITFTQFSAITYGSEKVTSEPFYTHHRGYKFTLCVNRQNLMLYGGDIDSIGISLCPMRGEYDSQLCWPVEVKVHIQLLDQAGDHHHIEHTEHMSIAEQKEYHLPCVNLHARDSNKYVMNDSLNNIYL